MNRDLHPSTALRLIAASPRVAIAREVPSQFAYDEGALWERSDRTVPRSLTLLKSALERARVASDDDRVATVDHAAARLVEASYACGAPAAVLLPAQRTLLLLGGRPRKGNGPTNPQALLAALDDVAFPSNVFAPLHGGFSRLLQSAIDAGEFAVEEEIRREDVVDDEREVFDAIDALGRRLAAIDDLTHALEVRPDFPAALAVGSALIASVFVDDTASHPSLLASWLSHRGVNRQLVDVVVARDGASDLDAAFLQRAQTLGAGQIRALCLWMLADQLATQTRPTEAAIPQWEELLSRGHLAPIDVFDTADLWRDLND